ncbi:hypothetical protein PENSPDRAFT_656793 [Peniophora sp. CONT]|nr:hypothetical protein PENSPDRAFT_656793 [Peniophora sp. CONT]
MTNLPPTNDPSTETSLVPTFRTFEAQKEGFQRQFVAFPNNYVLTLTESLRDSPRGQPYSPYFGNELRGFVYVLRWAARPVEEHISGEVWRHLFDVEILGIFSTATLMPEFWLSKPDIQNGLIECLADCAHAIIAHDFISEPISDKMMECIPKIFRALWDHRDQLPVNTTDKFGVPTNILLALLIPECFQLAKLKGDKGFRVDSFVPHMAVFTRVALGEQWKDLSQAVLLPLSALGRGLDPGSIDTPGADVEKFVEDVIIAGVGMDAFMTCMKTDLEESQLDGLCTLFGALKAFRHRSSVFYAMFDLYRLPEAMMAAVDRVIGLETQRTWDLTLLYEHACYLFYMCVHKFGEAVIEGKTLSAPAVDGDIAFRILARGLDLISKPGDGELHDMALHMTGALIHTLHQITTISNQSGCDSMIVEFVSSMRRQARHEWWPTLCRIGTSTYRAENFKDENMSMFRDSWLELGEDLGLSPVRERARHDRETNLRCCCPGCVHHRVPFTSIAELRKCAGCGEVQYCSRGCQKMDWSRHKARCKRLRTR